MSVRLPGFYWVHWTDADKSPFIAEWVEYQKGGKEMGMPPRSYWWEVTGTEDTFDDGELVVLSERLVIP